MEELGSRVLETLLSPERLRILELASIPELRGCKLAEHSLGEARHGKREPKTPKGNQAEEVKGPRLPSGAKSLWEALT